MAGSMAPKDKPAKPDAEPVFAPSSHGDAGFEIVVIDDDALILEMTLLTFREASYAAVGFADPLDALMWASDADPTLVVVDLKLPGIEGLDLVSAFCALGRHAVILVSAYVDVLTTVDAMRLGVDNVLTKPTSPERLLAAAEHALDALSRAPHQDILTFTRRATGRGVPGGGPNDETDRSGLEPEPAHGGVLPRQPAAKDPVAEHRRPGLGPDPSGLCRDRRLTRTHREHRTDGEHLRGQESHAAFDEGYVVAGLLRRLCLDGLDPGLQRHRRLSVQTLDAAV